MRCPGTRAFEGEVVLLGSLAVAWIPVMGALESNFAGPGPHVGDFLQGGFADPPVALAEQWFSAIFVGHIGPTILDIVLQNLGVSP